MLGAFFCATDYVTSPIMPMGKVIFGIGCGIFTILIRVDVYKRQDYRCIPVSRRILSDIATPIQVLRILKSVSRHCYMLESLEDADKWGR